MSKAKADMTFQDFEKSKKATARKAVKKGPVHRMSVEPSEMNGVKGYLTTAHHEPPASANKGGMLDHESMVSKAFHKTPEEMASHHSVMMGGQPLVPSSPGKVAEDDADGAGPEGD